MSSHEYTTAELRDGETSDLSAHARANLEMIQQLEEDLEDEEENDGDE